jgi:hypothetical protein
MLSAMDDQAMPTPMVGDQGRIVIPNEVKDLARPATHSMK